MVKILNDDSSSSVESQYQSESKEEDGVNVEDQSKEENKKVKGQIYMMLFSDWRVKVTLIPSFLLGLISSAYFFIFSPFINTLIRFYREDNYDPMPDIEWYCVAMAVVAVVSAICKYIDTICWVQAGSSLSVKLRTELFNKMMKCDVSFFDSKSIGEIITLLSEDAKTIQNAFGTNKSKQIQNIATFLSGIILTFIYTWKIGLIFLAACFLTPLVSIPFIPGIKRNSIQKYLHSSNMITIAQESISSIRTVRSYNQEKNMLNRFNGESKLASTSDRYVSTRITLNSLCIMFFMWGSLLASFYLMAWLINNGMDGLEAGDIFALYGFWQLSNSGLTTLMYSTQAETAAIAAGVRIQKIIQYQPLISFEGGIKKDDFKGHIVFENVSFKYPTRDSFVLRNVSLEIKPNKMTALVGHSGSGKSTCIQLIERFYDVTEGKITIDGINIVDYDPQWLHDKISCVQQDPTLFCMSIKKNILYGKMNASKNELQKAIELSNSKKFISKFPKEVKEIVGEKGFLLSGGQKQRIAIARAIIKDPVILLTDEATSSLDADNERKVQQALNKVMEGRTTVCVAHRLSTIRNAQMIYVFDKGEIKENGTHDDLVRSHGVYYNLVERQLFGLPEKQ